MPSDSNPTNVGKSRQFTSSFDAKKSKEKEQLNKSEQRLFDDLESAVENKEFYKLKKIMQDLKEAYENKLLSEHQRMMYELAKKEREAFEGRLGNYKKITDGFYDKAEAAKMGESPLERVAHLAKFNEQSLAAMCLYKMIKFFISATFAATGVTLALGQEMRNFQENHDADQKLDKPWQDLYKKMLEAEKKLEAQKSLGASEEDLEQLEQEYNQAVKDYKSEVKHAESHKKTFDWADYPYPSGNDNESIRLRMQTELRLEARAIYQHRFKQNGQFELTGTPITNPNNITYDMCIANGIIAIPNQLTQFRKELIHYTVSMIGVAGDPLAHIEKQITNHGKENKPGTGNSHMDPAEMAAYQAMNAQAAMKPPSSGNKP